MADEGEEGEILSDDAGPEPASGPGTGLAGSSGRAPHTSLAAPPWHWRTNPAVGAAEAHSESAALPHTCSAAPIGIRRPKGCPVQPHGREVGAWARRKWVGCSPVTDFEVLQKVGEGTFGYARHLQATRQQWAFASYCPVPP